MKIVHHLPILLSLGYVEGFTGNGFTAIGVTYTAFALTNWFAPLVVSFIGPRPTLIFGGIFYVLFIAQIMYPMNILLYMGSALLGFGGAMMWVAQGHFLTINSRSESCTSELCLKVNFRQKMHCTIHFWSTIVIFYTEILSEKVVLWCFFWSETSEKIHNSTFQAKISV